jgi:hypothetical protein
MRPTGFCHRRRTRFFIPIFADPAVPNVENPEENGYLRPIMLVILEFHALGFCGKCPTVQFPRGFGQQVDGALVFTRPLQPALQNSSRSAVGAQNSPPGVLRTTARLESDVWGSARSAGGRRLRSFIGVYRFKLSKLADCLIPSGCEERLLSRLRF